MRYVREISHQLRSAMLDDAGLGATVEQEGREFGERTGTEVIVRVRNIPALKKDVESDLYRAFQEATRNIEKHANATRVEISIDADKVGLWMRISDNGTGVVSVSPKHGNGIGLINMRERVERHEGDFEFHSEPGATTVTVFIPHRYL
jgi:two-component system NarL family sensor kinase